MKPESARYLEKARHALTVARALFQQQFWNDACSKAYYSMFYAAQSLLREKGIEVIKHSAVVAKFGEAFAKTGKIDPRFHRFLINAKQKRETADYDVFMTIDKETVEERIAWAKDFLREIEKFFDSDKEIRGHIT